MRSVKVLRRDVLGLAAALLGGMAMAPLAWAQADGLALFAQFLQQVRSGRAQFTQRL